MSFRLIGNLLIQYLFDLINGEQFSILLFDESLKVPDDFPYWVLQFLVHESLRVGIQPRHLDGVE